MTHTPGPWKVSQHMDGNHLVYPKDGRTPICLLAGLFHKKTKYANALVLAAAPELLEACKELLEACQVADEDEELSEGITGEIMDKARAAIAKTEELK